MKQFQILAVVLAILAAGATTARATVVYFDVNGTNPDSGATTPLNVYAWTGAFWNTDSTGGAEGSIGAWVNGDDAVYAAGGDGGVDSALNVPGAVANSFLVEEGRPFIFTGTLDTGANAVTVNPGATLRIQTTSQLNGAGKVTLKGTSLTNFGTLFNSNPGQSGAFLSNNKSIEIDGFGAVRYEALNLDNSPGTGTVSTYGGSTGTPTGAILGVGGTTTNGGAGTLIKTGPGEFRAQNNGMANNTFAKLVVKEGLYRLGNVTGQNFETAFGAAPLSTLTDAITLDGGAIGQSVTLPLHANRGITMTANGGTIDGNGGGVVTVNAPFTANGGTLTIIGRNLTTTSTGYGNSTGGLTLSNANNVTTFQAVDLVINSSTLTLNESLNADSLTGGSQATTTVGAPVASAVATGTVTIDAGKTFTVGADNSDTSYAGRVTGATGTFTKVGTGTLTLNTVAATQTNTSNVVTTIYSGEWTNGGGVNINAGTIKFGTANAGFTNTATATGVNILASASLDMNGINDTFPTLSGAGTVKMDDGGSAAGNLTLNGTAAGPFTFSGNISKNAATTGGNLTKSGAGSTHVLSGTNSVSALNANGGTILINGSTTASAGATVAAGAVLGGTGTIVGAITNNGSLAPGASVGTLSVTGNVTSGAGSSWDVELSGAMADLLAVTGNIDMTAVDSLNVTGSGTGSSWLIGTYTGTLSGVFDTITSGYTVSYTGGNITLNAAPVGLPGDFNNDGFVNAADYVAWRTNGEPGTGGAGPLPNDTGAVDQNARLAVWRQNFMLNAVPVGVPGDFNQDDKVDAGDYVTWRTNGEPNTAGTGPLPNEGGAADQNARLTLWRANFGNPGSGGGLGAGGAVPEPTAAVLVLLGLGALGVCRRGR